MALKKTVSILAAESIATNIIDTIREKGNRRPWQTLEQAIEMHRDLIEERLRCSADYDHLIGQQRRLRWRLVEELTKEYVREAWSGAGDYREGL